mmetsp:Transcript_10240/g.11881  ORF Transcript_10240/g.11881 Transcript_10240/m.11881 type:complete len:222 (+) Transcript_10240:234-899(+)
MELEDAKLLVKQLEGKARQLDNELEDMRMESRNNVNNYKTSSFMEEMRSEERRRELEVRKDVVGEYLERARARQMKLRNRYEEMKSEAHEADSYQSRQQDEDDGRSSQRSSRSPNDEASWKRESFGSRGRRRGVRNATRSTTPNSYSSQSSKTSSSSTKTSSTDNFARRPTTTTSRTTENLNLPPHRRITSRYERDAEDKRRLRELKVDEEIDRMRKELGL